MAAVNAGQAAELLEALVRHAMAEHAAIANRGFDSARRRQAIRDEIDELLDRHALLHLETRAAAA